MELSVLLEDGIMIMPVPEATGLPGDLLCEGEIVAVAKTPRVSIKRFHVGDRVHYSRNTGTGFKIDNERYLILRGSEVLDLAEGLAQLHRDGRVHSDLKAGNLTPSPGAGPWRLMDLRSEIEDLVPHADEWLKTPNGQLKGHRPIDLIGTPGEENLRDLILALKYLAVS